MGWFDVPKLPPLAERYRILTDGRFYKIQKLVIVPDGLWSKKLIWVETFFSYFANKEEAVEYKRQRVAELELAKRQWRVVDENSP